MQTFLSRSAMFIKSAGTFCVALSLLLVAFELKQSRDIAEAQLYGDRLTFNARIHLQNFDLAIAAQTLGDLARGETVTDADRLRQLETYIIARFDELDLMHFHRSKDLLPEELWVAYLQGMSPPMCIDAVYDVITRVWDSGVGYRKTFAKDINHWLETVQCPE